MNYSPIAKQSGSRTVTTSCKCIKKTRKTNKNCQNIVSGRNILFGRRTFRCGVPTIRCSSNGRCGCSCRKNCTRPQRPAGIRGAPAFRTGPQHPFPRKKLPRGEGNRQGGVTGGLRSLHNPASGIELIDSESVKRINEKRGQISTSIH